MESGTGALRRYDTDTGTDPELAHAILIPSFSRPLFPLTDQRLHNFKYLRPPHFASAVMSDEPNSKNRRLVLASNIRNLLHDLNPSTYDKVAPKVEFWIEYALDEHFTEAADLVDRVSCVAWENRGSHSDISRFLKEFRDAPNRSEQSRSFVNTLCLRVIRWFGVASSEDLGTSWPEGLVSENGGPGFIRAASFVGHLIKRDLLDSKLVRRHIVRPLTAHHYTGQSVPKRQAIRAHAIYQLFDIAGNALLQGLLEPKEVQDCFEELDTRVSLGKMTEMGEFEPAKLKVR